MMLILRVLMMWSLVLTQLMKEISWFQLRTMATLKYGIWEHNCAPWPIRIQRRVCALASSIHLMSIFLLWLESRVEVSQYGTLECPSKASTASITTRSRWPFSNGVQQMKMYLLQAPMTKRFTFGIRRMWAWSRVDRITRMDHLSSSSHTCITQA